MQGARVAQPQSGGRRAGVLQPGGCAAAGGEPGREPRQGEGAKRTPSQV